MVLNISQRPSAGPFVGSPDTVAEKSRLDLLVL
jgi:hypothetical protein